MVSGDYNRVTKTWLTLSAYFPISKTSYMLIDTTESMMEKENSGYLLEAELLGNLFYQSPKIKFVLNGGIKFKNNNTVLSKEAVEHTKTSSFVLNNNTFTNSKTDKIYFGMFDNFLSPTLAVRLVVFPDFAFGKKKESPFGFSFEYNKTVKNEKSDFELEKFSFGIPFSFKDKEGKVKVNFEPQLIWMDGERAYGVRLGLPFGGMIYK